MVASARDTRQSFGVPVPEEKAEMICRAKMQWLVRLAKIDKRDLGGFNLKSRRTPT